MKIGHGDESGWVREPSRSAGRTAYTRAGCSRGDAPPRAAAEPRPAAEPGPPRPCLRVWPALEEQQTENGTKNGQTAKTEHITSRLAEVVCVVSQPHAGKDQPCCPGPAACFPSSLLLLKSKYLRKFAFMYGFLMLAELRLINVITRTTPAAAVPVQDEGTRVASHRGSGLRRPFPSGICIPEQFHQKFPVRGSGGTNSREMSREMNPRAGTGPGSEPRAASGCSLPPLSGCLAAQRTLGQGDVKL